MVSRATMFSVARRPSLAAQPPAATERRPYEPVISGRGGRLWPPETGKRATMTDLAQRPSLAAQPRAATEGRPYDLGASPATRTTCPAE